MTTNPFDEIVDLLNHRFEELLHRVEHLERTSTKRMEEYTTTLVTLDSPYLTRKEAAKLLRCSTSTVDLYRRNGKLVPARMGGDQGRKVLFTRDSVVSLLN